MSRKAYPAVSAKIRGPFPLCRSRRRIAYPSRVKASDLERLTRVDEKTAAIVRIDPKTFALARDSAKALSTAVDSRLIASVAETMRGLETKGLVDVGSMRKAFKAAETFRAVDTTRFADALKAANLNSARFSDAIKSLGASGAYPSRFTEAFRALDLPPTFRQAVAEALKDVPTGAGGDLGRRTGEAVAKAVDLAAESASVEAVVEDSLSELDALSPAQRRQLQADVASAIATFGTLVAILARDSRVELASASLALAAILVVIFWRVTGKLNE